MENLKVVWNGSVDGWSNLSLSPEDIWLSIASIIFGIIHVQQEASIRNGDIYSEAANHFNPISWKKDAYCDDEDHEEEEASEKRWKSPAELQSGKQEARDEVRRWDVPTSRDQEHIRSDWDDDERRVEK